MGALSPGTHRECPSPKNIRVPLGYVSGGTGLWVLYIGRGAGLRVLYIGGAGLWVLDIGSGLAFGLPKYKVGACLATILVEPAIDGDTSNQRHAVSAQESHHRNQEHEQQLFLDNLLSG